MFPKICRVVSGFPEHDQSISDIFLKGISNHCLSKTLLLSHVEIKAIKKKVLLITNGTLIVNRAPRNLLTSFNTMMVIGLIRYSKLFGYRI